MRKLINGSGMEKKRGLTELSGVLTELPRGGYLVNTSEGYIQFGSPPETIKDTMKLPQGVPLIFILSTQHFDPQFGMSVAEIEFPIYYNYFLRKKKTIIYVHKPHIENMWTVLSESLVGPKDLDISQDVNLDEGGFLFDIKKEIEYFAQGRKLSDMFEIRELNPSGIKIGNVIIVEKEAGSFFVFDNDKFLVEVPGKINFNALYDLGKTINEPFIPPEFGITCLGPSHGFDPEQNTSGFILWINKSGIMVDPPANSTLWLKSSNVNPKFIDSIILTHCHADHDAGTFQKILEENRITIYTFPTIMQSFITKYSALTRIPAKKLFEMFNYYPVKFGGFYNIHGAIFKFTFSLHSIPTMSFSFKYRNKSFVYSSDHLNEPNLIKEFYSKGIISEQRMEQLLNFPWHYDIIYHEAGIPPLHTPISYLNSLPDEIKKKITVYHIAEKDFPKDTLLKLAKFGIGETFYPDYEKHKNEEAYHILDVFSRIDVFKNLPFERAKDLTLIVNKEYFKKGEYIIRKDTPGDKFYVIISGSVSVNGIGDISDKTYTSFEYFGEVSLITGQNRKADVIALTNVEAYSIEKLDFLSLIEGTKVEEELKKLSLVRDEITWNVLKSNKYFKKLSSSQFTNLEKILVPVFLTEKSVLICENEKFDRIFLLNTGEVKKYKNNKEVLTLNNVGDIVGSIKEIKDDLPSSFKYVVSKTGLFYKIEKKDLINFLNNNPGLMMEIYFDNELL